MKIKKFTCYNCGAPKINAYKSPYILCDFCGSFCDIDYTMGYDAWFKDPKRTANYQKAERKILSDLSAFQIQKKKKEYYQLQETYWDLYYKAFPEYLPPTINMDKPIYREYLFICADYSTMAAFDPGQPMVNQALAEQQRQLEYETIDGVSKVKGEGFFRYMSYYINYLKDSFKVFYETPEYSVMHQLLPPDVHLKMKMSMLVQTWLPYLRESDVKLFLDQTGFTQDYIDLPKVTMEQKKCQYCNEQLSVPEGALRINCESCHKTNVLRDKFNCMSCGDENTVPELPVNTMNCTSCGTENRLIKPLFG